MLLERWSLSYSPLQPGSSSYSSRAATDVAAVYKRLVSSSCAAVSLMFDVCSVHKPGVYKSSVVCLLLAFAV
jgi:hypothetical protein